MSGTLGRLKTDLGERSVYDAASQCSRCGYCEQACPTYVATGEESKSPRGRNQLVRLMLEGKLKDPQSSRQALSTCLLCGACVTACYARVATPDLVLEGRRMLAERPPAAARLACYLLLNRPKLFSILLKLAYRLKRLGLSRLAHPFLRLVGLGGLAQADASCDEAPLRFMEDHLSARTPPAASGWCYFAACGTNYLFPRVGLATLRALEPSKGPAAWLKAGCCGLLAYNYGDVADAKTLAQRVVSAAQAENGDVVVDCSSCAAFLKSYPQLFLDDPQWKERAERFSARVRDAVELLEPVSRATATTYHESCRACHGQGVYVSQRLFSQAEGYRPLPEATTCCGGAGAFFVLHPELSDEVLKRKIDRIAATRARAVATSSTSCLLQLAHGLKKYYPQAIVAHASEFAAGTVPDGTKART